MLWKSARAEGRISRHPQTRSVITDILSVNGRIMIEAMIAGQSDFAVLASLIERRIRATREMFAGAARPPGRSTGSCSNSIWRRWTPSIA